MSTLQLAIIVPCYYEEEVLPTTVPALRELLENMIDAGEIAPNSYACYINDGSQDQTWPLIEQYAKESSLVQGVNLSRNFGHQGAVLAGLFTAKADIYVSIDADLQDDELKIRDMVAAYKDGHDIVYGVRNDRESDTFFKRSTAALFYKLRAWLGCKTIPNHADFRLMSARAVAQLQQFGERNLFLRGVVPMLGFPSTTLAYARKPRMAGESKYPLFKMLRFAWEGVVNFSEAPLHFILWSGIMGVALSLAFVVYSLYSWYMGDVSKGWTSIVLLISLFGSMNFIFMGVIGLYLGKIFKETKKRPLYIVQESTLAPQ